MKVGAGTSPTLSNPTCVIGNGGAGGLGGLNANSGGTFATNGTPASAGNTN